MFRSIRLKFLLAFAAVILPLVVLLYYNNFYSIGVVREQVAESNSKLLRQYVSHTDKLLEEASKYLFKLPTNSEIGIFNTYDPNGEDYKYMKVEVQRRLENDIGFHALIDGIFVYSAKFDDMLLATNGRSTYFMEQSLRGMLPELIRQKQYTTQWDVFRMDETFVLAKIYEAEKDMYVGAVLNMENLLGTWSGWNGRDQGGAFILSGEGTALTEPPIGPAKDGTYRYVLGDRPYSSVTDPSEGLRHLAVVAGSSLSPIRFCTVIPETVILKNLPYFQKTMVLIPIAALLIAASYLAYFQRELYRPMAKLIRAMKRLANGELDVSLDQAKTNEFSFLNQSFNAMAAEIRNLKIDVYEEKLRVQEAEYKQLQLQINPHFYLNTLNIVSSLADLQEYKTIKKMVGHLVNYFRFVIRTRRSTVSIGEELEHIRNYLEIQKLRYSGDFQFTTDVPDAIRDLYIPPLTLQPFVENAVVHGFQKSEEKRFQLRVSGSVCREDDRLYVLIRVEDNGNGFEEEKLAYFAEGQYIEQADDRHVGIWNVHRRLTMKYGPRAYIRFANKPDRGAEVRIYLPADGWSEGEMSVV